MAYNRGWMKKRRRSATRPKRNISRYLAAASGATLGYIGGNIPGAIAGAKAGYSLAARKKRSLRRTKRRRVRVSSSPKSHADMTLIKFRLPGRKRLRKVDRNSKITYTDTFSKIYDCFTGKQSVFDLRYHMHSNQLFTNPVVFINDNKAYNVNLFDLNVNKTLNGSVAENNNAVIPLQQGSIDQDAFYLGSHSCSMSITSLTNVPAHIELYYLLAKKDMDDSPSFTWFLESTAMGNPQPLWNPPTNQAGLGANPGAPDETFYGQDPTFNPNFKKYWKILKKQEFILQAGNTIRMEWSRQINRLIRRFEFQQLKAGGVTAYAGLTFVPMIVVKPGPVAMQLVSGESTYTINTAAYKFGVMFTDTTTIYPVNEARQAINRVFSMNMTRTFGDVRQEFIDDEDNEQAVTVAGT